MKKRLAKRNFILISIALVLGLVFSFISFSIPFSNYIFKGFANSFNLGLAFSDGTNNTYEVEVSKAYNGTTEDAIKEARDIVQNLVLNKYHDGAVNILDDNKLSITVPDTYIDSGLLPTLLEMKVESGEDAEVIVRGSHIKSAKYKMSGTNHGVYFEFTSEGKKAFENLTKSAVEKAQESDSSATEGTIYIYFNKDYENGQELKVPEITQGYAYVTMSSKSAAKAYAQNLLNSRYEINLTTDSDAVTTHAYFTTAQKALVAVAVALIVVGMLVFMAIRYRELGWLSLLGMTLYSVLNIICLALLNAFRLNLGGIVGLVAGYVITALTIIVLFEKCHNEFKQGKKLPQAFKIGYRKSLNVNIDIFVCGLLAGVLGLLFTKGNLYTFSLAICSAVMFGALVSLLIMRGFMKMYLNIKSTKVNKINFTREETTNEI